MAHTSVVARRKEADGANGKVIVDVDPAEDIGLARPPYCRHVLTTTVLVAAGERGRARRQPWRMIRRDENIMVTIVEKKQGGDGVDR